MFVPVTVRRFVGPKSADALSEHLAKQKQNTKLVKIINPAMIRLASNGKIAGKFQLTTAAAREFGSRIAQHFGSSLIDLSQYAVNEASTQKIVEAVNDFSSLAYSKFEDWKLVIDVEEKLVVGLVGPRYRVTTNFDFWSGIRRTCLQQADIPRLFTATLSNRNLDIVMAGKDHVSAGSSIFVRGILAQNAETSGRAVRASNVLIAWESGESGHGEWACDNFYTDTRIPHLKGRRFDSRMTKIYDRLRARRISDATIKKAWESAAKTRLFDTSFSAEKLVDKLTELLQAKGLSKKDAKYAASGTVFQSQRPTVVDLFRALSRQAKGRNDVNAIKCRQVAYSLCFIKKDSR
jgi:hypothetical protein